MEKHGDIYNVSKLLADLPTELPADTSTKDRHVSLLQEITIKNIMKVSAMHRASITHHLTAAVVENVNKSLRRMIGVESNIVPCLDCNRQNSVNRYYKGTLEC